MHAVGDALPRLDVLAAPDTRRVRPLGALRLDEGAFGDDQTSAATRALDVVLADGIVQGDVGRQGSVARERGHDVPVLEN